MAYTTVHGKLKRVEKGVMKLSRAYEPVSYEQAEEEKPSKDSALKGMYGKNCNRTSCQGPDAVYYNIGSRAFYCEGCAQLINVDACRRFREPDLCYLAIPYEAEELREIKIKWSVDTERLAFAESVVGFVVNEVQTRPLFKTLKKGSKVALPLSMGKTYILVTEEAAAVES